MKEGGGQGREKAYSKVKRRNMFAKGMEGG